MTTELQNKPDPLIYFRNLILFNGIDKLVKDFRMMGYFDGSLSEKDGEEAVYLNYVDMDRVPIDIPEFDIADAISSELTTFSEYIYPDLKKEAQKAIEEIASILLYTDVTVNKSEIIYELKYLLKLSQDKDNTKSYPVLFVVLQGILDYCLKGEDDIILSNTDEKINWEKSAMTFFLLFTALKKGSFISAKKAEYVDSGLYKLFNIPPIYKDVEGYKFHSFRQYLKPGVYGRNDKFEEEFNELVAFLTAFEDRVSKL